MKRIDPSRTQTPAEHTRHYRERQLASPTTAEVYRAKHVEEARASRYKRKYGITVEQFDVMVVAQRGLCAACGHAPTGRLHVDHDHETGRIRGLLCGPCNRALGYLEHPTREQWDRYLAAARAPVLKVV